MLVRSVEFATLEPFHKPVFKVGGKEELIDIFLIDFGTHDLGKHNNTVIIPLAYYTVALIVHQDLRGFLVTQYYIKYHYNTRLLAILSFFEVAKSTYYTCGIVYYKKVDTRLKLL
ncbi:hypothetical protein CUN59_03005 [Cuspidothrix issatschenkoi CHARLIE-1]|uniref:Uncharacterized protein n=1 Tax=Cuspidothrix issatschenkoi CHARLIE-1 TaxID=2052836 RepID=A0A2S6CYX6_9CYAN|nr:hypothetical protein CUN59_03005 [Cuspidothrix issatschenkoi CHARLIE-1]